MTYTQSKTSNPTPTGARPCGCGPGCGCHDHAPGKTPCCKLTCFERPAYFCGQLLSDADLTLQENYFREKNKLYHRTLDGYGVVCGLRMYCDSECNGSILIGDGYAIDCCGNDLVVCQPLPYDVICELRKKKWLIEAPKEPHKHKKKHDPDDKEQGEKKEYDCDDECVHRQCFYIGICYDEQPSDYVTPYKTDCSPGPGPCQPTRVREGVRFEIYDKLPHRPNPLAEIEKRIERCFKIFREGQFSRGLKKVAGDILRLLNYCKPEDDATFQRSDQPPDPHQTFCELRAQFLHQLRICPDQYNCNLEHEVCELRPPCKPDDQRGPTNLQAFTRLLELIQKYVFSCVLAEFAFLCPDPPENCCVLIGSVEVENGRLTRVINYPRWYVWCFANFFEVLSYTLANDAACGRTGIRYEQQEPEHNKQRTGECCPGFEVDPCQFLTLFLHDHQAGELAARTFVQAMAAMYRSLVDSFDFMTKGGIAPAVLKNRKLEEVLELTKQLGFSMEDLGSRPAGPRDLYSALQENSMHRGTASMATFTEKRDAGLIATGPTRFTEAPAREASRLTEMESLVAKVDKLQTDLDDLRKQMPTPKTKESKKESHEVTNIDRVRYYDGEFLRAFDFNDEQTYHIEMRRRLNRYLHLYGIVQGLQLYPDNQGGVDQVSILPGMAIDAFGREIYVFAPYTLGDADIAASRISKKKNYDVWLHYSKTPATPPSAGYGACNQPNEFTRWVESFNVVLLDSPSTPVPEPAFSDADADNPAQDGLAILLGTVLVDPTSATQQFSNPVSDERLKFIGVIAQRIQTPLPYDPSQAVPPYKVLQQNTALSPPLSLEIMPNVFADQNLVVGQDFDLADTTKSKLNPATTTNVGSAKIAGDLFVQGNLYWHGPAIGGISQWYEFSQAVGQVLQQSVPEFVMNSGPVTVMADAQLLVPPVASGTATITVNTTRLTNVKNAIAFASITETHYDRTEFNGQFLAAGGNPLLLKLTTPPSATFVGQNGKVQVPWQVGPATGAIGSVKCPIDFFTISVVVICFPS